MNETTDFLVIGSGVAGLRAAIELAAGSARVTVLTKDRLDESSSGYAQGGVAVALADEDRIDLHLEDTLAAGAGLCDRSAVRVLVEEGPRRITELIEWGADFDREDGGHLAFTREAAHSRRRILHAHGDSTGSEIVRTLLAHARQQPAIRLQTFALTQELLTEDGRCVGVRYLDTASNSSHLLTARAVILATGGAGQIYSQTTNPEVATGDGLAMAWEAGAMMTDLEFVQFHPTALSVDGAPRFLLSEALRGEGGVLRNLAGQAFMLDYHPSAELAPRDVVSRSILAEMIRTSSTHVLLDMSHLEPDFLRRRFPTIYDTCCKYGLDLTQTALPVSPAAHYLMGGVRTDNYGRTSLPGLYAAGEVACTGVHGANRLASNSLLEGLVFGARAAQSALGDVNSTQTDLSPTFNRSIVADTEPSQSSPLIISSIRDLLWQHAGLIRTASGLSSALQTIDRLTDSTAEIRNGGFVTLARLIITAALWREESRGAHYRADFPTKIDPDWQVHSGQQKGRPICPLPLN
ncbi:MAG: L-aspartate oxidase [Acidobacteria bacterium]|nr:L-aspartate oxidase [Acidobacteriota bacterium]